MCTLPDHAGCSRDGADPTTRRDMLKRLTALGLTAPLATLILERAAMAGLISFLDRAELIEMTISPSPRFPESVDVVHSVIYFTAFSWSRP